MTRTVSLLVLALALLPSAANAQEPPSITIGTRVRVWTSPTAEPVTGKVLGLDATTMTLSVDDGASPTAVTRNAVTRIDVSRSRRSRGKTALYGALIGAGIGVVTGLALKESPDTSFVDPAVIFIYTVPVGVLVGVLVGAIVGPGPERWTTTMPTSAKLSQTVAPLAPSLRFSFRF